MKTLDHTRDSMAVRATCRNIGPTLHSRLDGYRAAKVSAHLERCLRYGTGVGTGARIRNAPVRVHERGESHPQDRLVGEQPGRLAVPCAAGVAEAGA